MTERAEEKNRRGVTEKGRRTEHVSVERVSERGEAFTGGKDRGGCW